MNNEVDDDGCPIVTRANDWPKDNKMAPFEGLVNSLRRALQVAIDKGDAVYDEGIEWNGLNGVMNGNHPCVPNIPDQLHSEGLKYAKERDRDAFTSILTIAVQLGMEQGAREVKGKLKEVQSMITQNSEYGQKILSSIIDR